MQKEIKDILLAQVSCYNETAPIKVPLKEGQDTPLFGQEGVLDSIGLVNLIVMVEEAIEDHYDVELTLADEKAMSQKRSPFRSVQALSEYIEERISEERE